MYRILAALALPLLLAIPGSHASAAPSNATTAQVLQGICNGHPVTVITNSGNAGNTEQSQQWDPGFVSGDGKIIPLNFSFTLYENGVSLGSQSVSKGNGNARGPAAGTPVTCSFSESMTQGGNTYTFSISVQGVQLR